MDHCDYHTRSKLREELTSNFIHTDTQEMRLAFEDKGGLCCCCVPMHTQRTVHAQHTPLRSSAALKQREECFP
jgi:hypothetical protein